MKKLLICAAAFSALAMTSALAADMPVKAPVYKAPVADPWNWNGYYVGGNVGYSWGHSATDATFSAPPLATQTASSSFAMNGWLGGLQIGANWQNNNNFVWGVEADIQAAGQKGDTDLICGGGRCTSVTFPVGAPITSTYSQKLDWFGTARLRGGVTITPTILAYATGGLAWGHIKTDGTLSGQSLTLGAVSAPFSNSTTKLGWTIGAGLEGRISGNWTAKIEYLYMDLGRVDTTATLPTNSPPLTANFSSKITDNILRVGVNYKFN